MKFRKEYDSIGSINVPVDKYWGASTQRSKKYFDIGDVLVRPKLIKSIAIIKKAAAITNYKSKDINSKIYIAGHNGLVGSAIMRKLKANGYKKIFVKIDTQGYEENIVLGADKVLNQIGAIMIETSISKVYNQEKDYLEMINLMKSFGFHVWSVERGFTNKKTGQVLQLDIIFVNSDAN